MAGLSAAQQSPNDYITQLIASGLGYIPAYQGDEKSAYQRAKKLTGLLDWTPLGIPEAGYQAGGLLGSGAKQRSVGGLLAGAGMTALAAMPLAGRASPLIKEAARGIKAYHGSPYAFDKFDISKIGTGEGAASFGHGLYFAEHPDTAKAYRDTLSKEMFLTPSGELFDPTRHLEHVNVRAKFTTALRKGQDPVEASLARAAEISPDNPTYPMIQRDAQKLRAIQESGGLRPTNGHMYEVNINADPAQFLDWDKPLMGQSEQVQESYIKALSDKAGKRVTPEWVGTFGRSGEGLHNLAAAWNGHSEAKAAEMLNSAGIPGIRYLDQGSRTAKDGTRNMVIFNPGLVDIMRRYAMPVGATGAAAATLPQLFGPQPEMSY